MSKNQSTYRSSESKNDRLYLIFADHRIHTEPWLRIPIDDSKLGDMLWEIGDHMENVVKSGGSFKGNNLLEIARAEDGAAVLHRRDSEGEWVEVTFDLLDIAKAIGMLGYHLATPSAGGNDDG